MGERVRFLAEPRNDRVKGARLGKAIHSRGPYAGPTPRSYFDGLSKSDPSTASGFPIGFGNDGGGGMIGLVLKGFNGGERWVSALATVLGEGYWGGVGGVLPGGSVSDHGIEHGEQFTHGSDQGHLTGLARLRPIAHRRP